MTDETPKDPARRDRLWSLRDWRAGAVIWPFRSLSEAESWRDANGLRGFSAFPAAPGDQMAARG